MEIIKKKISLNKGKSFFNWETPYMLNGEISGVTNAEGGNYGHIVGYPVVTSDNKIYDIKNTIPLVEYDNKTVLRYRTMMDLYKFLNDFISECSILRLCKRKSNTVWVEDEEYDFYTLSAETPFLDERPSLPTSDYEIGDIILVHEDSSKLLSIFRKENISYRYEIDFLDFANNVLKNPEGIEFVKPYVNIPLYLEQEYDSLGLAKDAVKFWDKGKKYYLGEKVYNTNSSGFITCYNLAYATDYDIFEITKNEDYDLSQLASTINTLVADTTYYKTFYSKQELENYATNNKFYYKKSYILCSDSNKYYFVTPYYKGYYDENKRKLLFDDENNSHWKEIVPDYGGGEGDTTRRVRNITLNSKLDSFIPFKRTYENDNGTPLDFNVNENGETEFLYSLGVFNKRTVNDTDYVDILYSVRTDTLCNYMPNGDPIPSKIANLDEVTPIKTSEFGDDDTFIEFVYYIGVDLNVTKSFDSYGVASMNMTGVKYTETYNLIHSEEYVNYDNGNDYCFIDYTPVDGDEIITINSGGEEKSEDTIKYELKDTTVSATAEWDDTSVTLSYVIYKKVNGVIDTTATESHTTAVTISENTSTESKPYSGKISVEHGLSLSYSITQDAKPESTIAYELYPSVINDSTTWDNDTYTIELTGETLENGVVTNTEAIPYEVTLGYNVSEETKSSTGNIEWNGKTSSYTIRQTPPDNREITYAILSDEYHDETTIYGGILYYDESWTEKTFTYQVANYVNGILSGTTDLSFIIYKRSHMDPSDDGYYEYTKSVTYNGTQYTFYFIFVLSDATLSTSNATYTIAYSATTVDISSSLIVNGTKLSSYYALWKHINIGTNMTNKTVVYTYEFDYGPIKDTVTVKQEALSSSCANIQFLSTTTNSVFNNLIYTETADKTYAMSGNAIFPLKLINVNSQEISVIGSGSSASYSVYLSNIDDEFNIVSLSTGYNEWRGGSSFSGSGYLTFTTDSKTFNFNFNFVLDEDNTAFLSGMYISQVFRIPYIGGKQKIYYFLYPYTFNDRFFYEKDTLPYNECYYWENNIVYSGNSWTELVRLNNNVLRMISGYTNVTSDLSLTSIKQFTFKPNKTDSYKELAFVLNGTLVIFLQEPYSSRRIYYGTPAFKYVLDYNGFDDMYIYDKNDSRKYHSLINVLSSKIVDEKAFTIIGTTTTQYACIPSDIDNSYTTDGSTVSIIVGNYSWGNQNYNIYSITNTGTVNFKLL